jgi:hypothetical protein
MTGQPNGNSGIPDITMEELKARMITFLNDLAPYVVPLTPGKKKPTPDEIALREQFSEELYKETMANPDIGQPDIREIFLKSYERSKRVKTLWESARELK